MKYLKEFTGCDTCRGKGISGKTDGYIFLPETHSVIECSCHKQFEKTKNLFYKLSRNGFDNSDFIMANPPFNQNSWRKENELVKDSRWLLLHILYLK